MALVLRSGSRNYVFFIAVLATVSLFCFDALRATETAPLPDHVTKEFGKPPAIPEGPLSEELQSAVKVAFIDSMTQSTWGRDQTLALGQIAEARDPRIAWIIADLMRFIHEPRFHRRTRSSGLPFAGHCVATH